jgi:hypothetical protein
MGGPTDEFFNFIWGIYCGEEYVHNPLHNSVTHGDHRTRTFSIGVSVEGKSLQHHPQVCTINVLEIMFGTRAYIEITCSIPFFKFFQKLWACK